MTYLCVDKNGTEHIIECEAIVKEERGKVHTDLKNVVGVIIRIMIYASNFPKEQ
jgi:hypothetical protein|nr:MAG TPA: hypothetical protein [Bacteriophage sp.]